MNSSALSEPTYLVEHCYAWNYFTWAMDFISLVLASDWKFAECQLPYLGF
jgi:hypothetical protein